MATTQISSEQLAQLEQLQKLQALQAAQVQTNVQPTQTTQVDNVVDFSTIPMQNRGNVGTTLAKKYANQEVQATLAGIDKGGEKTSYGVSKAKLLVNFEGFTNVKVSLGILPFEGKLPIGSLVTMKSLPFDNNFYFEVTEYEAEKLIPA